MELVLRKRSTGDALRLSRASVLGRRDQKLALLAPYPRQWVFYSLASSGSGRVAFNRRPAPRRCPVSAGDLLELGGLELIVDSVRVDPTQPSAGPDEPSPCEIVMPGEPGVRVDDDVFIGYDPCCGLSLAATLDLQPPAALLSFVAGVWHLHDLDRNRLVRNGKPDGTALVLADGDRVRLRGREIVFRIGAAAPLVPEPKQPAAETVEVAQASQATVEIPVLSSPTEGDPVYHRARELCRRLLPALRDPDGPSFRPADASCRGFRGWLGLLRRPAGPAQILDRLEFLLSGSPRDRVWLLELARFLFRRSYPSLCHKVLRELAALYPNDEAVMQTLAKFYYRQGVDARLPAWGRTNALRRADRWTRSARRSAPNNPALADLQQAIGAEQEAIRGHLGGATPETDGGARLATVGRRG